MASSPSDAEHVSDLYRKIYAVVRTIPRGRVATYGQIAELAGIPRAPRVVGYAMRACGGRVPWQRVVGRRSRSVGQVTIKDPVGAAEQRARLEREGVRFTDTDGISLSRYGWLPSDE